MNIPDSLVRHPTQAAIDRLAALFELRNDPGMQDWEIEIADSDRRLEFLDGYESLDLNADERFTLMWTILQSFEDIGSSLDGVPEWQRVLKLIESEIELHIYTVWYWAAFDSVDPELAFRVSPYMRELLGRHEAKLKTPKR